MIKDIMSRKIIFGNSDSSIKDISRLMKKNNIGFIPIKEKDKYIGVITDRDLALSVGELNNINDSVKSYITNSVIYINSNSNILDALRTMSKYKVKRLLVKEKDNTVGVLSLSDILNYTNSSKILDTYKSIFYIHDNEVNNTSQIDEFYL